jgi:carboxymethylenebutenolidase
LKEKAMGSRIVIEGRDAAAPAVVVPQEAFGLNADTRKHCDELAGLSFIAVASDLFRRPLS